MSVAFAAYQQILQIEHIYSLRNDLKKHFYALFHTCSNLPPSWNTDQETYIRIRPYAMPCALIIYEQFIFILKRYKPTFDTLLKERQ